MSAAAFLASGRFADGQVLDVWQATDATRQPAQATVVDPVTMTSSGVTVTGLEFDTAYVAGNIIGGRWIGIAFRTPALVQAPEFYVQEVGIVATDGALNVGDALQVGSSLTVAGTAFMEGDGSVSGKLFLGGQEDTYLHRTAQQVVTSNARLQSTFGVDAQLGTDAVTSIGAVGPDGESGLLLNDPDYGTAVLYHGGEAGPSLDAGLAVGGDLAVSGDSVLSGALSVKEQVNVVPTSLSDQNVVLKAGGFAAGFGNGPAVTFTKAAAGGSTTNDMSVSRVYDSVNGDHLLVDSPAVFQGAFTTEDTVALQGNFLGFYNATPAVKPTVTGSRGANAALASLLTKLAALGLITDSTS